MKKAILYLTFFLLNIMAYAQTPAANDSIQNAPAQQPSQYADSIAGVRERAEQGDPAAQTILGFWHYNGFEDIRQDYKLAVSWWEKAAKQNNPDAIANLGYCYQRGHGVEPDSTTAFKLFESAQSKGSTNVIPMHDQLARQQKSVFSALLLEDIYRKGIGTKKDVRKAEEYLVMAAEYGHTPSISSYAMMLYNTGKYDLSAPWMKTLADKGDPSASLAYGLMLFEGKGVAQDKQQAVAYLTSAEEKGNYSAAANLGRIYYEGDGVGTDSIKAFEYLLKAAPYDKTRRAQWLLALCYKDGVGTRQDYHLATQWMADAIDDTKDCRQKLDNYFADEHNTPFLQYLQGLYKYHIDENFTEAQKYFRLVENSNIAESTTMTALCLADRKNPKRNVSKAVKLLTKALPGSPLASFLLARLYAEGDGVQKDTAKALELLTNAAEAGLPEALCELGDRYMTGNGVPKDITHAAKLYLQAEKQHHLNPASAKNLARCYEQRVAALPDLDKADARIKALNALKPSYKLNELLAKVPFNC